MVQRLLEGAVAGLALSGVASGHPIRRHLTAALSADAETAAPASQWTPQYFDPRQNQLFTALAERIVPGSARAQVDRIVDLLLTVETDSNQKAFNQALTAMEAEAVAKFPGPFAGLSPRQQDQVLTEASSASESPLREHFENLKGWIVGAYYSTEIGMRELGWTEDSYFEWTGCEHQEGHQ
jgi:hypothetical protein